jgi:hypothetical protein
LIAQTIAAVSLPCCLRRRLWVGARPYLYLLAPYLVYLLPLLLGYSWNTLGGVNVLNPPEGYGGRMPAFPITAEPWGASVVNLPFDARIRAYVGWRELPLWNPYQGLGQTFLAQGDGNPFFPPAILRAFLPDAGRVLLTLAMMYASACALYRLLRNLGIDELPAVFGGVALSLSGAFSLHLARPNLADQTALFAVLLWAVERAIARPNVLRLQLLAAVTFLHTIAGFIQIAFVSMLVATGCAVLMSFLTVRSFWPAALRMATVGIAIALGVGLAGFSILPTLEAMREDFAKNTNLVWTLPPFQATHIVMFFAPAAYGYPFQSLRVIQGQTFFPVDWDNLFAFAGALVLLVSLIGVCSLRRFAQPHRLLFLYFLGSAALLFARYLSIPPFDTIDMLPVFSSQTRKHANESIVVALVIAAAISAQYLRHWSWRAVGLAIAGVLTIIIMLLARSLVYISYSKGRLLPVFTEGYVPFLIATVAILCFAAAAVVVARWQVTRAPSAVLVGLLLAQVAELAFFVPLGRGDATVVYLRLLATSVLFLGAFLLMLARRPYGPMSASIAAATAVIVLVQVVQLPGPGLSQQFEAGQPPRFLNWLQEHSGDTYRTFGIFPDFSSLGQVQDLSVVGPLAPRSFLEFVNLTSSSELAATYRGSTEFMLAGRREFDLHTYCDRRSIFDWLGVRYLVLDRSFFGHQGRQDHEVLMNTGSGFTVAYADERVQIVESATARPKAEFVTAVRPLPNQAAVLTSLRRNPARIDGPPLVEAADGPWSLPRSGSPPTDTNLQMLEYRPNRVSIAFQASAPGLLVLKDAYAPGWQALLDGAPTPVVRVNGMVRGVRVPHAGNHHVVLEYRPDGFRLGTIVSFVCLVGGSAILAALAFARSTAARTLALAAGVALMAVVGVGTLRAFLPATSGLTSQHVVPDGVEVTALTPEQRQVRVRKLSEIGSPEHMSEDVIVVDPGAYVLAADGQLLLAGTDGTLKPVTAAEGRQIAIEDTAGLQGVAQFDGSHWQTVSGTAAARPAAAASSQAAFPDRTSTLSLQSNFALGRPARQSSSAPLGAAEYAVDGHAPTEYPGRTTASTQSELFAWWEVDLGQQRPIATIEIAPPQNLAQHGPAYLMISSSPLPAGQDPVMLATRPGVITRPLLTLQHSQRPIIEEISAEGRYVRIQLGGQGALHLGEVRVWSDPLPPVEAPAADGSWRNAAGAVGVQARQSSTRDQHYAALAIDGNLAEATLAGTTDQPDAWWEVDLGQAMPIRALKIWNRTDCCQDDREMYVMASEAPFISTRLQAAGQPGVKNVRIAGPAHTTLTVPLDTVARYVRVQMRGSGTLNLGEVQVWTAAPAAVAVTPSNLQNLTLGRSARQSSTGGDLNAERAVDGVTNGDARQASVSQTDADPGSWWEVDLGAVQQIERIDLFNRTDCCGERLREFFVLVSNERLHGTELSRFLHTPGVAAYYVPGPVGEQISLPVDGRGRYVRVQLARSDYLALAEVQVWGPGR